MPDPPASELIRARWEAPDAELLAEIRRRVWTAHNIPLAAGESTLGPTLPLIGADERTIVIKSTIRRLLRPAAGLRVLDLGTLEGGLAFEMAREGWDVVGVEARRSNFEKAELIRRYYRLPNLRFWQRDVKTLAAAADGTFDVVLCCGLLYHLDEPFAALRSIAEMIAGGGLLFLDTHVAPAAAGERRDAFVAELGEMTSLASGGQTYDGRWFNERRGGSPADELWSATSNPRSFWPTHESLVRGLYHAGLHAVFEIHGAFPIDRELELQRRFSRLYLVGLEGWAGVR
jgi:SAM-dependent methyltransferase